MSVFVPQPKILDRLVIGGTLKPDIMRRIEKLGRLEDRAKRARGQGNRMALLDIADDYDRLGCPRLANDIRAEAMTL